MGINFCVVVIVAEDKLLELLPLENSLHHEGAKEGLFFVGVVPHV